MKIKLNVDLNGHKVGDIISLKVQDGLVIDRYWRRRVLDSRIDNCVSVIETGKKPENKKVENNIGKDKGEFKKKDRGSK